MAQQTETERMSLARNEVEVSDQVRDMFARLERSTRNDDQKTKEERTQFLFLSLMEALKRGDLHPFVCKKCVCVSAREVTPEEVGKEHIVWSHGQVEKTITLTEGTVLITTLDEFGNPIVDEQGHENVYDMPKEKFYKKYKEFNGNYIQEDKEGEQVKIAVVIPDKLLPENGLTVLPPNWGGYDGTLMRGGIIMLPFDPSKDLKGQIESLEKTGWDKIDWYPNNESQTYAPCDKNGIFENENLKATFKQTGTYEGYPLTKQTNNKR